MRTFGTFLAVGILALAAGCGGSSSTGYTSPTGRTASSGGYICKNQSCAAQDSYYSCLAGKCDAQAKSCFGPSYASGTFAGACQTLITCSMACPCDDTGSLCLAACYASLTSECATCVGTITACQSAAACVSATCTNDSGTAAKNDGSTTTGTNCTTLLACCPTMAAAAGMTVQECQSAFAELTDATCASTLAAAKSAGLCQ